MIWIVLGVAAWVGCGVLAFGVAYAYFVSEFPSTPPHDHHTHCMTFSLGGPISLLVIFFAVGYAKHGLLFRESTRRKREAMKEEEKTMTKVADVKTICAECRWNQLMEKPLEGHRRVLVCTAPKLRMIDPVYGITSGPECHKTNKGQCEDFERKLTLFEHCTDCGKRIADTTPFILLFAPKEHGYRLPRGVRRWGGAILAALGVLLVWKMPVLGAMALTVFLWVKISGEIAANNGKKDQKDGAPE